MFCIKQILRAFRFKIGVLKCIPMGPQFYLWSFCGCCCFSFDEWSFSCVYFAPVSTTKKTYDCPVGKSLFVTKGHPDLNWWWRLPWINKQMVWFIYALVPFYTGPYQYSKCQEISQDHNGYFNDVIWPKHSLKSPIAKEILQKYMYIAITVPTDSLTPLGAS